MYGPMKNITLVALGVLFPSFLWNSATCFCTDAPCSRQQTRHLSISLFMSSKNSTSKSESVDALPKESQRKSCLKFEKFNSQSVITPVETPSLAERILGIPSIAENKGSNMRTRIIKNRRYAKSEPFSAANFTALPTLSDLGRPPSAKVDKIWIGLAFRAVCFSLAYLVFPFIIKFLEHFITLPTEKLDEITASFGPGVSILYGTFISLTLSILYQRIKDIQTHAARESSYLNMLTRDMLSLFKEDREHAVEAAQCVVDQIGTLVQSSRGDELLQLMYADPYSRMLDLIECKEEQLHVEVGNLGSQGSLISSCRDLLKDLVRIRAERLSDEALALPPTHFLVLNLLTFLILLGYSLSVFGAVDAETGYPPEESSLLFAILTFVYLLFYNFARDLNDPFTGVYQLRRSSIACHLLETKMTIASSPVLLESIDFGLSDAVLYRTKP